MLVSEHQPAIEKPLSRNRESGLKRVRRFERPTFTLATCKDTDPAALAKSIPCGDGKGVTRTGTNRCPKKCNQVEPPAFNVIKLDLAGQSGDVSLKAAAICFTD